MSVSISWNRTESTLVGNVRGRIDTQNAATFDDLVKAGSAPDEPSLILDFSKLSFISSAGLRILLLLAREYGESGRTFGLCGLPEPVQGLMEISGFIKIVQIFDSHELATRESDEKSGDKDAVRDSIRFREAFNARLIRDKLNDIVEYAIQKHENVTGTSIPPEKLEQARAEITVGLREVSADMRKTLQSYREKLFYAAEVKLKEVIGE